MRRQRRLESDSRTAAFDPATITWSTRYYVPPGYLLSDPAAAAEPYEMRDPDGHFYEFLDAFLGKSGKRYLLILGDSGMGKTSLLLNYYAERASRGASSYRLALGSFSTGNVESFVDSLNNPAETILLLDAFDEDGRARTAPQARLEDVLQLCSRFRGVVITSRSQFFSSAEAIPRSTGLPRLEPRPAGIPAEHELDVVYLAPFDERRIAKYLRRRFPFPSLRKRFRAKRIVAGVPYVSVRPMLLACIPDLLESGVVLRDPFRIYDVLIEQWCIRESGRLEPEALREFSIRLAINLFTNKGARAIERISRDALEPLANQWGVKLDEWQLTSRSLLNRDERGLYKFAHRSFLEFLVAKAIAEDIEGNPASGHPRVRPGSFDEVQHFAQRSLGVAVKKSTVVWLDDPNLLTDQVSFFLGHAPADRWNPSDELRFFGESLTTLSKKLSGRVAPIPPHEALKLHEWGRKDRSERVIRLPRRDAHGIFWRGQLVNERISGLALVVFDLAHRVAWLWRDSNAESHMAATLTGRYERDDNWQVPEIREALTFPSQVPRPGDRRPLPIGTVRVLVGGQPALYDVSKREVRSLLHENPTQSLRIQAVRYWEEVESDLWMWDVGGGDILSMWSPLRH